MQCTRCILKCNYGEEKCENVKKGKDVYPYQILMITQSKIELIPIYHYIINATVINIWIPGSITKCDICPWSMNLSLSALELRRINMNHILDIFKRLKGDAISIMGCEPLINEWVHELIYKLKHRNVNIIAKLTPMIDKDYVARSLDNVDCVFLEISEIHEHIDWYKIYELAQHILSMNIHVEIGLVVNPNNYWNLTNIRKSLTEIAKLNKYTPLHIIPRTIDDYQERTISKIVNEIIEMGYLFCYVKGDPTHRYTTTRCPKCKTPLILRDEFGVKKIVLRGNKCPFCGFDLKIKALKPLSKIKVSRLFSEEIVW